jgi:hypothetical protein
MIMNILSVKGIQVMTVSGGRHPAGASPDRDFEDDSTVSTLNQAEDEHIRFRVQAFREHPDQPLKAGAHFGHEVSYSFAVSLCLSKLNRRQPSSFRVRREGRIRGGEAGRADVERHRQV